MSKDKFDTALAEKIEGLSKQVQPERDLWPGIDIAISQQAQQAGGAAAAQGNTVVVQKSHKGLYAIAASILLVGVLSWSTFSPQLSGPDSLELVEVLSNQHQQQKDALLVSFKDQPALTENWQEQLQELDEAAGAIKAALAQEPDNVALLKMLQNVHQQQITLIERVHSPKWRQI